MTDSAKSGRTSHDSSSTHQHNLPPKKSNLRSLVTNCNGISNKRAELENLINYTGPDLILLTETKIDKTFVQPNSSPLSTVATSVRTMLQVGAES